MAAVQASPMANMPGTGLPANLSQESVQALYARFQQLKQQGTPPTDPEFQRTQQILMSINQQQRLRQAQMQARQQQIQATNAAPPQQPVNGRAPTPASQPMQSTPTPAPAGSIPMASGPAPSGQAQHFTPQNLALLRQQIAAFKCLSKNFGVPPQIQQAIVGQRQRRQASAAQQIAPSKSMSAPLGIKDTGKGLANGVGAVGKQEAAIKTEAPAFKTLAPPENLLENSLTYFEHGQRRKRLFVPGIFPAGIDFDQLRADREKILFNRMSARYNELRSLPGNMAHWDTSKENLSVDDTLKRKAIIEMKSIALYSKQRALRDKIGRSMMSYDNLAMTTNRTMYRRVKKQSVREARITEKLEKQQRDAREHREKQQHTDQLRTIFTHRAEFMNTALSQRRKYQKLGQVMYNHHFNIEKEEQKRIERTAKQRLQALKNNDEEAYLKLLDQAKDTRISHLLRQTDGFLTQLASSVKAQQRAANERYGTEAEAPPPEEEESDDDENAEEKSRRIDYYAIAHRVKEDVTAQASILVGGTLKEYQIKGLQWMMSLYNNNLNGILADEMGLGKTIQTISLITYLIEKKQQMGPYLVIVPLSTLTNWTLEFEKWAPSVGKIVYKGPPPARKIQQDKIRSGRFQVLLTTYEYIIKDRNILSKIKWFHMIIDEGHRMKNAQSKLSATIQQYYSTRFRLILTGTPLQNNLSELWAMLNFTLPTIFKSATSFDEWFNTPFANTGTQDKMELSEEEQLLVIRRLHKVLRPFLLRRLKKDVEKDLPDKTEKVIKCKFSALQARLYKQMMTHNKLVISDGKGGKTGARGLSNMIMQLRKLCNHPFVFNEVEDQMSPSKITTDALWRSAGKFELLDRVLPKYKATGHRVLMFFQMTAIMDIMEDFLRFRGITYLRLDGTTKADDRSELLYEFNRPDSPYFMFLLSTRAGGLGLNLQTADTVIIYDSDWNPHQDLQAQDRAHRIGQKNEVRILRLIHANSVEEKILERARYKLDMDGKVIQAGRFDNKSSEVDRDTLLRSLLENADGAANGEDEDMDDDELNMILARSDDELALFQELDAERAKNPIYGTGPGSKGVPRLMADNELPDIYLSEDNPVEEEVETVLGRGARERTRVKYDDGLTEEQWVLAVDDDEDSPEAAAARKAARKEKRAANRAKRESMGNGGGGDEELDDDSSEEEEVETPVKKGRGRGAKTTAKQEKRKAEDGDDEPPPKKRRGPAGRPKAVAGGAGGVSSQLRVVLKDSMRRVFDSLMKLEVDDPQADDEEDDDDDEPPQRLIIGPFIKLPPKRDYGDYYLIIKDPICMNQIEKKIKKDEYNSLGDLQKDIALLCRNCQSYNEDGSLLHTDANTILAFFTKKMQEELESHPELNELEEGGSSTHGSVGARTKDNTPQPTPAGPMRIKLTNNAATNGGSSGAVSDDED